RGQTFAPSVVPRSGGAVLRRLAAADAVVMACQGEPPCSCRHHSYGVLRLERGHQREQSGGGLLSAGYAILGAHAGMPPCARDVAQRRALCSRSQLTYVI